MDALRTLNSAVPPALCRPLPSFRMRVSSCSSSVTSENGSLSRKKGPIIVEIPLDKIRRPLLRTRTNDPEKVKELMESIAEIGLKEPIDVLEVDGIFYGFSGCHRFEAHQRLGLPTIKCRVRRATKETLRHHLR
ncbi:hypothetical protein KP509_29G049000 [Ceratopteris richardii]|uniref:sulfiredoxin n=1 Tax=Ceratopteris richardii TaxID=49495 RepID=A0A8T2R8Z9_CERRI|nr:hypothetical protein KP509_29G049000 [Ceratopteris richardii]